MSDPDLQNGRDEVPVPVDDVLGADHLGVPDGLSNHVFCRRL